jgi:FkbM family methyltransferase
MEALRRVVRGGLGYRNPLYVRAAGFANAWQTIWREGYGTYKQLQRLAKSAKGGAPEHVAFRELEHPFPVRPGTADASVLVANVVRAEYGQVHPRRQPRWLIDAGGYIGDTTAFFLSRYPTLRALVLEPSAEHVACMRRNLNPYRDRVTILQKGLWSVDATLRFSGQGVNGVVGSSEGDVVDCVSIPTLIAQFGIDRIDILKLDIEGAEREVVGPTASNWLDQTSELVMEIHGPDIERSVAEALARAGFAMRQHRSVWYCRRP